MNQEIKQEIVKLIQNIDDIRVLQILKAMLKNIKCNRERD
ncbi:hypothetical protein CBC_A0943 [Clostridium botulinum C str. Eklund]|nr:hypothetical protein CBC_A0943 [Clostridium botulinum C str. Eklund]